MTGKLAWATGTLWMLAAAASAQDPPTPKKAEGKEMRKADDPAESRQKIIKHIQTNMEDVRKKLEEKDPGEQTRSLQKKIIEDIDRLLRQQNNNKNNGGAGSNGPQPPVQPQQEPPPSRSDPKQTEKENPAPARQNPGIAKEPGEKPQPKSSAKPSAGQAKTKPPAAQPDSRPDPLRWNWQLPTLRAQDLDAFGRDRLPPRYEELLRAYYRTIAERKDGE